METREWFYRLSDLPLRDEDAKNNPFVIAETQMLMNQIGKPEAWRINNVVAMMTSMLVVYGDGAAVRKMGEHMIQVAEMMNGGQSPNGNAGTIHTGH